MIRAVLFDLDGTLTNTLQDIADAMNRALRLHGLEEYPVDAYRYLVGNGAVKLSQRVVRDRQELAEPVRRTYQEYYEQHAMDSTAPYEGIPELLQALQARGVKMCVLSNKPDADTRSVVQHYFPQITFAHVQGQLPGVPVKPDPTAALEIARELGVAPEEFLYLGDTDVDMRCAVNAGMQPVGVLWGFREAQELLDGGAQLLIDHPIELLKRIEI